MKFLVFSHFSEMHLSLSKEFLKIPVDYLHFSKDIIMKNITLTKHIYLDRYLFIFKYFEICAASSLLLNFYIHPNCKKKRLY